MSNSNDMTSTLGGNDLTTSKDAMRAIPTVSIAELDQPPEILRRVSPAHLLLGGQVAEEKRVLLRALVDENGEVEFIEVVRSSGKERSDQMARDAVVQWRFTPRTYQGDRAKFWTSVSVSVGK